MTSATGATEKKSDVSEPSFRIRRFSFGPGALLRVALVATAVAYVQTITYAFVFDDLLQIEMNPWIQSWKHWRDFFTGHVWSFGRAHAQGNYYRPTFLFWLAGNYSLFKLTPGWWHLTTVAAHLVAMGLVYVLASRVLRDRWAGAIAALLFGLYPLHIESVAWVSGIPEVLLMIFFVAALLAYQNSQAKESAPWMAASVLLYALALLSKETALAFLPVVAVCMWREQARGRKLLLQLVPYLLVTIGYLVARERVLGGMAVSNYPRPMTWVVATWPSAVWFYLRQMLWPFRLSLFYDFDLLRGFSLTTVALPLLLTGLATAALVYLGRKAQLGLLTVVWILAPLAPVLIGMRVFQWHDYVHDRYTYLPSVMIAIVMAAAITRLRSARMQALAVALIAIGLGVSTVIQARQWESDLALFTRAHERAPQNPLPLDYMARTLFGLGRTEEAIVHYQELLRADPDYWNGNYVLGLAYYQLGRYDEAEKYLTVATRVWPREFIRPEAPQFYYLGLLQQRKSDFAAAEVSLRKAVELRPEAPGYRYALAIVLQQQGNDAEAKEQLRLDAENRRASAERQKEFDK